MNSKTRRVHATIATVGTIDDDLRTARFVWLLVCCALALRLWGTWYGLPFSYWIDEYHEVMRALELGSGGFNFQRTTKGGFYYLLFVEYGIYYAFLRIFGVVESTKDFAVAFVRDPSLFYLMGRVTAAMIGSATILIVFRLARRAYGATAGLLAAAILTVNLLHVDLSRMIGVDIPMAMLAFLALYFAQKIVDSGRQMDYVLAALFAALSATTKLPGILVLVPLLIAHTFRVVNHGGGPSAWLLRRELWVAALAFASALILTNPGILSSLGFVSSLFGRADASTADVETFEELVSAHSSRPNLYVYYALAIAQSMGWPLLVVALLSAVYAVWRRAPMDAMLLSYAVVNYFVIASTTSEKLYYPRYALPIVVALVVLSGRALADLSKRWSGHRSVKFAALMAVLLAWPIWQSAVTAQELTKTDTRTLAKNWIEANVPEGSRVLIEGLKIAPIKGTVQLHETPIAIERRIDYWKEAEPKQARFLELQLLALAPVGFDLQFVRIESITSLHDYRANGVQYFVVRPDYFEGARRADARSAELLRDLRGHPSIALLKRFEGRTQTPPGPTIEVYGPRSE